jgi:hypothetical protein
LWKGGEASCPLHQQLNQWRVPLLITYEALFPACGQGKGVAVGKKVRMEVKTLGAGAGV